MFSFCLALKNITIEIVILWFFNKNIYIYLIFVPVPGTELHKHLEFSTWWEGQSFFFSFFNVNEVTFGSLIGHLRMKAGCQDKQHVIGELDISDPAPNLQGGEKGEGIEAGWINVQWFNQLYLGNEGSVKTQMDGVLRASRLRSTWRSGEGGTFGESMGTPFHNSCCPSPIWLFLSYILL